MADSSLNAIRTKVRRLTRSLTDSQLSTAQIDQYINTFVQYDFPEHLRLFNLRTLFNFYTIPGVDSYKESTDPNSPLYQFQQRVLTVHQPVYVAGYQVQFSEDRTTFFGQYPIVNNISSLGVTGNGVTSQFNGVINSQQNNIPGNTNQNIKLLQNQVLFNSVGPNNSPLAMIDYPLNDAGIYNIGNLYVPGFAPTSTTIQDPNNYINYSTGQFVVTFKNSNNAITAPINGSTINSQVVPQQAAKPTSMLFFDGFFTLRPIPDHVYEVSMEVYIRPTELLNASQSPELQEWWQYIAYGAAKKVFEDRMDMESVQMIMTEFKKQETLILRRTIVQQTSQRTYTIYTENNSSSGAYGGGYGSGGGSF